MAVQPAQQISPQQINPQQTNPQQINPQQINPQRVDPQRVDPYAAANPYGLPAVPERPYVPMQRTTLPPVPMAQVHDAHNGAAIGSVVVGAVALCLSLVGVVPGAPFFYYSAGGVLAIVGGVRALARSRRGFGTARVAPVAAIVLGSLAVMFMVIGFAIHTIAASTVLNNGSYTSQAGAGTSQQAAGPVVVPAPPAFTADPELSNYEAQVSQLASDVYLQYGPHDAVQNVAYPATLAPIIGGRVDFPNGSVTFTSDETYKYVPSADGKSFDIAVSGGTRKEVAVYDSLANEFTWSCYAGASVNCPAGGLDPNSNGTTTSNS